MIQAWCQGVTNFVNQSGDLVFGFIVDVNCLSRHGAKSVAWHLPIEEAALPQSRFVPTRKESIPNGLECGN
jgi:hypothetical protein